MSDAPFARSQTKGYSGNDVWVTQDALRAWGKAKRPARESNVRRFAPTGHFQEATVLEVKHFQKLHSLPQTGVLGKRTWDLLEPYMTAKDIAVANDYYDRYVALDERTAIVAAMFEAYTHRLTDHYLEIRRMTWVSTPEKDRDSAEFLNNNDCSALATWGYYVGTKGRLDPTGFDFTGWGNTGSLTEHGTWTKTPQLADLALYTNPGHVAVVTRIDSRGIWVVSDGQYPMNFCVYNYGHPFVGFKSYID